MKLTRFYLIAKNLLGTGTFTVVKIRYRLYAHFSLLAKPWKEYSLNTKP